MREGVCVCFSVWVCGCPGPRDSEGKRARGHRLTGKARGRGETERARMKDSEASERAQLGGRPRDVLILRRTRSGEMRARVLGRRTFISQPVQKYAFSPSRSGCRQYNSVSFPIIFYGFICLGGGPFPGRSLLVIFSTVPILSVFPLKFSHIRGLTHLPLPPLAYRDTRTRNTMVYFGHCPGLNSPSQNSISIFNMFKVQHGPCRG